MQSSVEYLQKAIPVLLIEVVQLLQKEKIYVSNQATHLKQIRLVWQY